MKKIFIILLMLIFNILCFSGKIETEIIEQMKKVGLTDEDKKNLVGYYKNRGQIAIISQDSNGILGINFAKWADDSKLGIPDLFLNDKFEMEFWTEKFPYEGFLENKATLLKNDVLDGQYMLYTNKEPMKLWFFTKNDFSTYYDREQFIDRKYPNYSFKSRKNTTWYINENGELFVKTYKYKAMTEDEYAKRNLLNEKLENINKYIKNKFATLEEALRHDFRNDKYIINKYATDRVFTNYESIFEPMRKMTNEEIEQYHKVKKIIKKDVISMWGTIETSEIK